jgi:transposase
MLLQDGPVLVPKVGVPAHQRVQRGRKPLDPALPRDVIRYELPEAERVCPHNGSALKETGVDASEQFDMPLQMRVIRHDVVKYARPCCSAAPRTRRRGETLPKACSPRTRRPGVITARYQDALPSCRLAVLLARFCGEIARNTLAPRSLARLRINKSDARKHRWSTVTVLASDSRTVTLYMHSIQPAVRKPIQLG